MKRVVVACLCLLVLVSCGGSKAASIEDLQKSNEDLQRRVKSLEDELLDTQKKHIQHQHVLQAMHDQLRDMENAVNKIELGPAR